MAICAILSCYKDIINIMLRMKVIEKKTYKKKSVTCFFRFFFWSNERHKKNILNLNNLNNT